VEDSIDGTALKDDGCVEYDAPGYTGNPHNPQRCTEQPLYGKNAAVEKYYN
jgi:hypothetical protein